MSERIRRREFNKTLFKSIGVGVVALTGINLLLNADSTPSPDPELTPTLPTEQSPFSEKAVQQRVSELLNLLPPDEDIVKVYTGGDVPELNDIYTLPYAIGVLSEGQISKIEFIPNAESITPDKKYRYTSKSSGKPEDFPIIQEINGKILFSDRWYNMQTPEAQMFAVRKEARTLLQNTSFNRFAYQKMMEQGVYELLDPTVDEWDMAVTEGHTITAAYPQIRKLHDFGPYLMMLQEYDALKPHMTEEMHSDIELFLPEWMREDVTERGIKYQDIAFNSEEYADLAFADSSPWVQYILQLDLPTTKSV